MSKMYKIQVRGAMSNKWFDLDRRDMTETAANRQLEILRNKAGDYFRKVGKK